VQLLVGADAAVNLQSTVRRARVAYFKLLICNAWECEKTGYTALMYAAREGHTAVAQILLNVQADPNISSEVYT
jgi:C4-type Zn-finger protein